MAKRDGWAGILDPDENILWQGRPVPGFTLTPMSIVKLLSGAIFAGFALFWIIMASTSISGGLGWFFGVFGLPFLFIGLGIMASGTIWPPYRQKHTWYSLTHKRAFIATDLPLVGRQLKSYPMREDDLLELVDGPLQSVYFTSETATSEGRDYAVKIGFERLTDGREVYRMLRDIRANAGQPENGETDR